MKKLLATLVLALVTTACAQTTSTQSGMKEGMQCKCCQEMMMDGKECCCKGMMDSGMKMDMDKKDGKMQSPMCAKMKEGKSEKPKAKPVTKAAPDGHEQHH